MTDNSERSEAPIPSKNRLARYTPHLNGTAFMGMLKQNETHPEMFGPDHDWTQGPYVLASDADAAIERLTRELRLAESARDYANNMLDKARSGPETATESAAARDVLAERRRQIESEGWHTGHDDEHDSGQLAKAASCYALCAGIGIASAGGLETHYAFVGEYAKAGVPRPPWPWADEWWKPKNPRRDLVRAGALILAEIERLDRAGSAVNGEANLPGE